MIIPIQPVKTKIHRFKICLALCLGVTSAWSHPPHEEMDRGTSMAALRRRSHEQFTATPEKRVTISIEGKHRVIRANGIPDHPTGAFPNANNPNTIASQDYTFFIPLKPAMTEETTKLGMYPFGVALNGVVFDPGAAEWWNRDRQSGWQYEPMNMKGRLGADQNNAHVQPTGAYHYHSVPSGLIEKLSGGGAAVTLLGWAADGFPIYGPWGYSDSKTGTGPLKKMKPSFQLKKGTRPDDPGPGGAFDGTFVADYEFVQGSGDLDECNGIFGPTPEFPEGIYHYFVTDEFPFIPRQFNGTPDSSFFRQGPPRGFHPPNRSEPHQRPPHRGDFPGPERDFGAIPEHQRPPRRPCGQ